VFDGKGRVIHYLLFVISRADHRVNIAGNYEGFDLRIGGRFPWLTAALDSFAVYR
jgi:hypothetical protein